MPFYDIQRGSYRTTDKQTWTEAINEKKKSLEENNTWEIMDINRLIDQKLLNKYSN